MFHHCFCLFVGYSRTGPIWAHNILYVFFGMCKPSDDMWLCAFNTLIAMPSISICPLLSILSFSLPLLPFQALPVFPSHVILHIVFSKLPQTYCSQTLDGSIWQSTLEPQPIFLTLFSTVAPHPMLQAAWSSHCLQNPPFRCVFTLTPSWVWEAFSSFLLPQVFLASRAWSSVNTLMKLSPILVPPSTLDTNQFFFPLWAHCSFSVKLGHRFEV